MRLFTVLWLAIAAWTAPSVAGEPPALVDRVGDNILVEAEAIHALAAAIDAQVKAGTLTLSAEAQESWASGRNSWAQIRELASNGDAGAAYKAARQARPNLRMAFREAFLGRPDAAVTDALKAYVEAIGPRVTALTHQIENYPLTAEGRESFHIGAASWSDAKDSAKKKKWDQAFRLLMDAVIELDKVVYESYPPAR